VPFHLPEFLAVESPAFSPEGFAELEEVIFEAVPDSLPDVEMGILEESWRPELESADDFTKGGPQVEANAGGRQAPMIELTERSLRDFPAIEGWHGFSIEDLDVVAVLSNLIITTPPFGPVFVEAESSAA
jgi:hypothetical protein